MKSCINFWDGERDLRQRHQRTSPLFSIQRFYILLPISKVEIKDIRPVNANWVGLRKEKLVPSW